MLLEEEGRRRREGKLILHHMNRTPSQQRGRERKKSWAAERREEPLASSASHTHSLPLHELCHCLAAGGHLCLMGFSSACCVSSPLINNNNGMGCSLLYKLYTLSYAYFLSLLLLSLI